MVGARCTGTLVATIVAAAIGWLDAVRRGASPVEAWSSGAFVAAVWLVPVLVAELVVTRRRPVDARARVAVPTIAIGALLLVAVRQPLASRFSDRELIAWLWAGLAVALVGLGIAVGQPLARRLADRSEPASGRVVSIALGLVVVAVVLGVAFGPPVRGLAADLRL